MWNLKNSTNTRIYKTGSQTWKTNMATKAEGGGINGEFGINRHKPSYIKQANNKDLLTAQGKYTQYNNQ